MTPSIISLIDLLEGVFTLNSEDQVIHLTMAPLLLIEVNHSFSKKIDFSFSLCSLYRFISCARLSSPPQEWQRERS